MTITELAKRLNITTATLRYYESIGLVMADRSSNGNRDYSPEQADRAKRIAYFRHAGVSIDDLEQLFDAKMSNEKALVMLHKAKKRITRQQNELANTLDFLNYKIGWHEQQKKLEQLKN